MITWANGYYQPQAAERNSYPPDNTYATKLLPVFSSILKLFNKFTSDIFRNLFRKNLTHDNPNSVNRIINRRTPSKSSKHARQSFCRFYR